MSDPAFPCGYCGAARACEHRPDLELVERPQDERVDGRKVDRGQGRAFHGGGQYRLPKRYGRFVK